MTDRSETAVQTLMRVDPEFQDMVAALYGPGIDAEAVWNDVFGGQAAPISKGAGLKALAIGSTIAGAALAAPELRAGLKGVKAVQGAVDAAKTTSIGSKLVSTGNSAANLAEQATSTSNRKLAVGGAALAGDADVVNELRKKPTAPVTKSFPGFPSLGEHVKGIVAGAKKAGSVNLNATGKGIADFKAKPVSTLKNAKPKTKGALLATGAVGAATVQHKRVKNDAVAKGTFDAEGTFSKLDADKRLAFGFASVVKKDGLPVIDRQGDVIDLDELEEAAYRYVHTSRVGGDMHRRINKFDGDSPDHVSDMVESLVITPEKLKALGLAEDALPHGWWVGFKIHDDATWDMVKNGERTGFSVHGSGRREAVDLDSVMA